MGCLNEEFLLFVFLANGHNGVQLLLYIKRMNLGLELHQGIACGNPYTRSTSCHKEANYTISQTIPNRDFIWCIVIHGAAPIYKIL
jgi:hypothetical protein